MSQDSLSEDEEPPTNRDDEAAILSDGPSNATVPCPAKLDGFREEKLNRASKSALSAIRSPFDTEWKASNATAEVNDDIDKFIERYDSAQRGELRKIAADFYETRIKDSGIRKLALWGTSLSRLYDLLPDDNVRRELYVRARQNAMRLVESYNETHSYIENATMRGWPMYVAKSDAHPTLEAFNFGHIGMAVCHAARMDADNGHHRDAAEKVRVVLNAMYDGFLTQDKGKKKLDSDGWVVYVPRNSDRGRKIRHKAATKQKRCLGVPQAYNHGIMVARAAMACEKAMRAINWADAGWLMEEWTQEEAMRNLTKFIKTSAELLLDDFEEVELSSRGSRDRYPGAVPATFYRWRYRNLTNCPKERDSEKHRFEDISHGSYQTDFLSEFYQGGYGKVRASELRKLILTFLNRIVRDYNEEGGSRFACAVDGTHDSDKEGPPGWPRKSCINSRTLETRSAKAPQWLTLASVLRDAAESDQSLRCDVLLMVKTVLDLVLPGVSFDSANFAKLDPAWASHAIVAKYYYYNYEAQFNRDCGTLMKRFFKRRRRQQEMTTTTTITSNCSSSSIESLQ